MSESVDLSPYAGKPIALRFEYITDPAVTLSGFLSYRGAGLVLSDARGLSPMGEDFQKLVAELEQKYPAKEPAPMPKKFSIRLPNSSPTASDYAAGSSSAIARRRGGVIRDIY